MRADLHVHSIASPDGRSTLAALCAAAKAAGLDAIAVTDHDLCTDCSGNFPVTVIPGVEITTTQGHILGLFLDTPIASEFFNAPPSAVQAVAEIRRHGGLAVPAHPFAPQKLTESEIAALAPDAIEAENARAACSAPLSNSKARALAEKLGLCVVGGSDAHCAEELGGCITELFCADASLPAMKQAIAAGRCRAIFRHACRRRYKGLSQWQKHRRGTPRARLWAFFYLHWCIVSDYFRRK